MTCRHGGITTRAHSFRRSNTQSFDEAKHLMKTLSLSDPALTWACDWERATKSLEIKSWRNDWLTRPWSAWLDPLTLPPLPQMGSIKYSAAKNWIRFCSVQRKKSRENVKSVRLQWLSFSTAKKRLRGVFSDLSKSKKCHKCCGFFNISFTVICKTKSLIRLDCVPHNTTQFSIPLFPNFILQLIVTTLDFLFNSWKSGRVFSPFACINPKTVSKMAVSILSDSKRCFTFLLGANT